MATRFKILRRLGGAPGAPSLPTGELGYNDAGHIAGDKDSLYVGSAIDGTAALLVSKERQVETSGEQLNITGKKVFRALGFGDNAAINDVAFPVGRGTSGQILKLNSSADQLEWTGQASIDTQSWNVTDAGGSVYEDICAMDYSGQNGLVTSFIVMTTTELHVFTHAGTAYLWVGPNDNIEVGAGGSHVCVDSDVSSLGSSIQFASDAEIKAGTITNKAISPKTGTDNYLRKLEDAGDTNVHQTMQNSMTIERDLQVGDGVTPATLRLGSNAITGTDDANRFKILFSEMVVTGAQKLTGAVQGVVQGDGATVNQMDNLIFDAGTF